MFHNIFETKHFAYNMSFYEQHAPNKIYLFKHKLSRNMGEDYEISSNAK